MLKRTFIGDALWISFVLIITALFILPLTQQVFIRLTDSYPYIMGFFKFAILATMGELLALRLAQRSWKRPVGIGYKFIVWGIIGMLITYMFSFFSAGVSAMLGKSTFGSSLLSTIYTAFLTSVIMNLTFGIVFMGMHRISDTYIETWVNGAKPSYQEVIQTIDWDAFITIVVSKTIPLFWIPAHTITFSLPTHYRVVVAAYLSIILGVILVYSIRTKKTNGH